MRCEVCDEREADVCNMCVHEITTGVMGPREESSDNLLRIIEGAIERLEAGNIAGALEILQGVENE